ncbi:MAG TPA: hypothetical protein VF857_06195, partial [Spirochaetota bacterium]
VQYTINGNRLAHIVDNGVFDFDLSLANVSLTHNAYMKKFSDYLLRSNIKTDLSACVISQGGITYHQTGENGIFQKFSVTTDHGSINGFGRYSYAAGVSITGECSMKGETGLLSSAPFTISGALTAPLFQLNMKQKDSKSENFIIY